MGALAINGAADRLCGAEDLLQNTALQPRLMNGVQACLDGAVHGAGHGASAHGLGNVVHIIERDVAGVLDCRTVRCASSITTHTRTVLLLLAVTRGLLERLDHERCSRGHHVDGGLHARDTGSMMHACAGSPCGSAR